MKHLRVIINSQFVFKERNKLENKISYMHWNLYKTSTKIDYICNFIFTKHIYKPLCVLILIVYRNIVSHIFNFGIILGNGT